MRDPTVGMGPDGAGAGIAAFLMMRSLVLHQHKGGHLSHDDLNQMLIAAIESLGSTPDALRQDAKDLLIDMQQQLRT